LILTVTSIPLNSWHQTKSYIWRTMYQNIKWHAPKSI